MDIVALLGGLKDKVLDLQHIELLKSAYEFQEMNIEQLKTALESTRGMFEEKKRELARLMEENAGLTDTVRKLEKNASASTSAAFDDVDTQIEATRKSESWQAIRYIAKSVAMRAKMISNFHGRRRRRHCVEAPVWGMNA